MLEQQIERDLIEKLSELKYTYRPDIRDRATLEQNFRKHFEELNRVHLTDNEFARLLEDIVTSDVFVAARYLRERNTFERDDGTPLVYMLVNIKDRTLQRARNNASKASWILPAAPVRSC